MILILLLACGERSTTTAPCADDEVLDEAGACQPLRCGEAAWQNAEDERPRVYVAPDGDPQGEGSAAAPLAGIQQALDRAAELRGGTVLVAAGTYAENLAMGSQHTGVKLLARCSDLVTVTGGSLPGAPVLSIAGANGARPEVEVAGVTLTDAEGGGVVVLDADASLRDVSVSGTGGVGIRGTRAGLLLESVTVRGTTPSTRDVGIGVGVDDGSTLTLRGAEVSDNASAGVYVAASTAELDGVFLHDNGNVGLAATRASTVTGHDIRMERHVALGAYAEGSDLTLSDTTITDVIEDADGNFGFGVGAEARGHVVLDRVEVSGATSMALMTMAGRGVIEARQVHLHDTRLGTDGTGHGVGVQEGGRIELVDSTVENNLGGAYVVGEGSRFSATGSTFARSRTEGEAGVGDDPTGQGILARSGAEVTLEGCTVADNDNAGVIAADSELEVRASTVRDNRGVGVYAAGPQMLVIEDTVVERTRGSDAGIFGRGIEVFAGVEASLRNVQVVDNEEVGVFLADSVDATLVNVEIRGTRRSRTHAMASGLVVANVSTVGCRGCVLADNEGPGAYMGAAGTLDLNGATVTNNRFAGLALVGDGWINATDTVITDNLTDKAMGGGFGVYAMAVRSREGGYAEEGIVFLSDSEVGAHPYAAVWLDGPGEYQLRRNVLHGGPGIALGSWQAHGNALFAMNGVAWWSGFTGLLLEDNTFRDATDAAILLHGATARFEEDTNVFRNNGADLIQQRCMDTTPIRAVPYGIDADICTLHPRLVDANTGFRSLAIPEAILTE